MTKEVYTAEELSLIRTKIKRNLFIETGVLLLATAINVTLCFFVDDTNATWLKIINMVLSVLAGWFALYFLFNVILPGFARKKYVSCLLSCDRNLICGCVVEYDKSVTIEKHIMALELKVIDEEGRENILYWDKAKDLPDFGKKEYRFAVVQNKIAAYGDAQ